MAQGRILPLKADVMIKRLNDNKYSNALFGNGMSRWNSATTLRGSVPHFSVPKSVRFPDPDPKKMPPGPN